MEGDIRENGLNKKMNCVVLNICSLPDQYS